MTVAEYTEEILATAPFDLRAQSPTIGAHISGLDLGQEQSPETIEALRAALLKWKVLFFHEQHLSQQEHIRFTRQFGELEIHPLTPIHQENPEILRLIHDEEHPGRENFWHSDVTWRPEPSLGSILRAVEIPSVGGDTCWADMYAAYDNLTDEWKEKVTGLEAVHDFLHAFAPFFEEDQHEEIAKKYPAQNHPVVRTHPETGRRGLYVNFAFTDHIIGMEPTESEATLEFLYSRASIPEYQVRLTWAPGTIAFWDNRSTQHYAVNDYWPYTRIMERVTVCGDKPYFDPKV